MKIAVAGTGYVGMSMAALLAQHNDVIVVDVIPEKVNCINAKKLPFKDENLQNYIIDNKIEISATLDGVTAYKDADYVVVAVSTDYDDFSNSFDTSNIENVLDTIVNSNSQATIVIKSTVPIGYTNELCKKYIYNKIIFCPEFIRETKVLYDMLAPSRIIVGIDTNNSEILKDAELFVKLLREEAVKKDFDIIYMKYSEAEAVKLFSNSYLALRVSFFNELDTFAEIKGLDSQTIINGVCKDYRIGDFYNNPSFGYGGYCLPKDTKQLQSNYNGLPQNIISAIEDSNKTRKKYIANRIIELIKSINNQNDNYIVGIYRIVMKRNSDNYRQSAILDIIDILIEKGLKVVIYEPLIGDTYMFRNCRVINDLEKFKSISKLIVANRYDTSLNDVKNKVYTRDLYTNNKNDVIVE